MERMGYGCWAVQAPKWSHLVNYESYRWCIRAQLPWQVFHLLAGAQGSTYLTALLPLVFWGEPLSGVEPSCFLPRVDMMLEMHAPTDCTVDVSMALLP